jgi:hypothetical protein
LPGRILDIAAEPVELGDRHRAAAAGLREGSREFGSTIEGVDVSGDILAREADYCHLMISMRFEPMIYPASADGERTEDPETGEPFSGNELGWIDPLALDENQELLGRSYLAHAKWLATKACWHGSSASTVSSTGIWLSRSATTATRLSTNRARSPGKVASLSASTGKLRRLDHAETREQKATFL